MSLRWPAFWKDERLSISMNAFSAAIAGGIARPEVAARSPPAVVSKPARRDMLAASGPVDAMMQLRRAPMYEVVGLLLGTRSAFPARLPSWVTWAGMSDRVR